MLEPFPIGQTDPRGLCQRNGLYRASVSAIEAKEMGLVNQVFDSHEALVEGVMSIAAEIASKAPLAVYGCKRMINYARDHTTQDGLDYVAIWNASHFQKRRSRRPCSLGLSVAGQLCRIARHSGWEN